MKETFAERGRRLLDNWKRKAILKLLGETNWSISKAARRAGVDRANFYRTMKRLGIKRPSGK